MSEPAHEPEGTPPTDIDSAVTDAVLADAGLADPAFADAALTDAEFSCLAPSPNVESRPDSNVTAGMRVAPAHCLRCGADLSRLPDAARYCPRCGLDGLASPPAALLTGATQCRAGLSQMLGGWQHLSQLVAVPTALNDIVSMPSADATSVMVKGYGNALYRLGQRYETAPGAGANAREALRCYSKSARLGNVWALARIASHLMAGGGAPAPIADEGGRNPFNADPNHP